VLELGAGSGVSFAYYPEAVAQLIAVEPEPNLRDLAQRAAASAPIPVRVVDGVAERLPAENDSVDAVVVAGLLCSLEAPLSVLAEIRRVLRPGGELRFYEHVIARNGRLAAFQRALDATFWPRLFGGCHTARDTEQTLIAAGFTIEVRERFSFRPTLLATPVAPRIIGRARCDN
jgi:ubiquinone/menaquinone biosynthesis C-methylase UbiE